MSSNYNITKVNSDETLTIFVSGRIDTQNAAQFEEEVKASLQGVKKFILDIGKVTYISSSGLRVFMGIYKMMSAAGGEFIIRNPIDMVYEVLDVTGFSDMLTVER